ncbi:unnamed protein product [Danaus chrysippus]|uniref:(African queen) hypothetical protein n=1 Tax=Danaus chrysippus TaxID=151541 RepID=A0A8J2QV13_9NEOP|nr:unnamed protein product [Danaus chrysippus]
MGEGEGGVRRREEGGDIETSSDNERSSQLSCIDQVIRKTYCVKSASSMSIMYLMKHKSNIAKQLWAACRVSRRLVPCPRRVRAAHVPHSNWPRNRRFDANVSSYSLTID